MTRSAVIVALTLIAMAVFMPFALSIQAANAQTNSYTIQRVEHSVQVLYSGQVVINETIQISGQMPSSFTLGLPYRYGSYLLKGTAVDSTNRVLPVTLGVQLQDKVGFYGAAISLPTGTSNTFTVILVLSNGVLTSTATGFNLDFPAYLSFLQTVNDYSAILILPSGTTIVGIDKPDGIVNATSYTKSNLSPFTYSPATATVNAPAGSFQEAQIPSLVRQISVDSSGAVRCTDTYKIINNSTGIMRGFLVNLPVNAKNVVARDQFGRVLPVTVTASTSLLLVENVTFAVGTRNGETSQLTFDYSLPSVSPTQPARYVVSFDLFPYFNYYVDTASVTIVPPEAATVVSPDLSQLAGSTSVSRSVFQESLTISKTGVTYVDSTNPSEDVVAITYEYNSLWVAFRPTSWAWATVLVGVIIIALWTRSKTKAVAAPARVESVKIAPGVTLSPDHVKSFIEAYEEKSRITQELRTLEARAQHGRIPRRRYKVQRRTLELRLESLSQNLAQLKEILRRGGGRYADAVRQLEAADVELNEVALSLENIEVKHESGELALEPYKKQLSDLERRKEKAEGTVNSVLTRLRGESQ